MTCTGFYIRRRVAERPNATAGQLGVDSGHRGEVTAELVEVVSSHSQ